MLFPVLGPSSSPSPGSSGRPDPASGVFLPSPSFHCLCGVRVFPLPLQLEQPQILILLLLDQDEFFQQLYEAVDRQSEEEPQVPADGRQKVTPREQEVVGVDLDQGVKLK